MRLVNSVRFLQICGLVSASVIFSSVVPSIAATSKAAKPVPAAAPAIAEAGVVTAKKSPSEQLKDIGAVLAGRLRIGASVNTASKLSGINIKNRDTIMGSVEANVSNTPAIDIQWAQRLYEGPGATKFDWFVGATFERERSLSSLDVKLKGSTTTTTISSSDQNPTFHANSLTAGIRWTPTENVFVPMAFNYGFLSQADWGSNGTIDISPTLGVTAGAGYRLSPAFEIEAVYKMARYDILLRPKNFAQTQTYFDGSVDLNGVVVSGRYVF